MHAGRKCTPGPVACPLGDRGVWGCRRLGLCCPASGRPSREAARAAGPGEAPEHEMAAGRGRSYGRTQRKQQPIPARGPTRSPPPPRACALRDARSRVPAPRAGDTKGWRESAERGRRSGPGSGSLAAQPGGNLGPFPAPRLQRLQRPRRPRASIFPRSSISTQPSSCCIPGAWKLRAENSRVGEIPLQISSLQLASHGSVDFGEAWREGPVPN